jgi:hypothetical protein
MKTKWHQRKHKRTSNKGKQFTAGSKKVYYHVTKTDRVSKILKEGLTFGHKARFNSFWGKGLGERNKIYVVKTLYDAMGVIELALEGGDASKNTILKIAAYPQYMTKDDHWQSMGKWFIYSKPIPRHDILEVIDPDNVTL